MVKHIILWTIKDEYKDNIDEIKASSPCSLKEAYIVDYMYRYRV